jgi:predicted transcriptional regulator
MAARRGMGELEADVMGVLWAADGPRTPAEVRDGLAAELAYTTVMTILARLWEKGLAQRERQGRAYAYRPTVSEAELAAQRMRATLDRVGDREKTLVRFVDELTPKDERVLRAILERLK